MKFRHLAPVLAAAFFLGGCVQRTLRIESEPPGARLTLDGKPLGTTPREVSFEWYGSREIILEKKGYRSLRAVEPISPPWWAVFPVDFFTEVLLPLPLEDRHLLRYRLEPFGEDPDEETDAIIRRAEAMKAAAEEE